MVSINYDGKKVNKYVSDLTDLDGDFNSISSSLKECLAQVISARGFNEYIGGINSDFFSQYVEEGRSNCNNLVQEIRNVQIQILSFNQDDDEIDAFLDSLSVTDYKTLDLSPIEDHISFIRKAGNVFKGIGSFAGTLGTGAVEGVLEFGETGADLITLGGTSVASIFTKGYDFITGENVTEKMWADTKAFVSKKHVESIFNSFYDDTAFGKYLKNNASINILGKNLGYKEAREFSKNIGYTTSIIATSGLTGIPMPLIAGTMGFSRGTEDAWADGATLKKGLIYGTTSGAWEAAQWQIGTKIDSLSKGIFSTSKGNALKVALDSVDAGVEGFIQPAMNMIYQNYDGNDFTEKYAEAFKENGGWGTVASQLALGGFMSASSKIFQSIKTKKSIKSLNSYEKAATVEGAAIGEKRILEKLDDSKVSYESISEQNRRIAQSINEQINNDGSYIFKCNRSKEINAEVLKTLDNYGNLDKVKVVIDGPFRDSNGNYKGKYNNSRYNDRITYTGYEALSIVSKLDELQAKIDMSLPTKQRAHQIYEVLADEYNYMHDFNNYADGHKVAASLRGLTSNNAVGKKGLVCAGYAQAYSELCDRCGIRCEYIRGDAVSSSGRREKHAWNVFFDDNGDQIPVDVTWKSGSSYDEWFGKSKKFADSHVADPDEIFRNYSPLDSNISSFDSSTINNSLKKIIDTMDKKYGLESGYNSLKKYIETGNANCITRTNGCRDIIQELDFDDINNFLLKNDYNYASSILDKYTKHIDTQYGQGSGKYALQLFLSEKNNVIITRKNNFRNNISYMPREFIEHFINGG